MKKLTVILLVLLALCCAALVGCGGTQADKDPEFCAVVFDAGEGTFADGTHRKNQAVFFDYPATKINETPTRDGYVFVYWEYKGVEYDFKTGIRETPATLSAVWETANLSGDGTAAFPYLVSSPSDLVKFADCVNKEKGDYLTAYYKLTADIDASAITLYPIGSAEHPFAGAFNGNGKKITGLTVNEDGSDAELICAGFFSYAEKATVKDIEFKNVTVSVSTSSDKTERVYAGVAFGYADTVTAENVSVNGVVSVRVNDTVSAYQGGFAGVISGGTNPSGAAYISYVRGVYSSVSLIGENLRGDALSTAHKGGIVSAVISGGGTVALIDCVNVSDILSSVSGGGIVAMTEDKTTLINCYNGGAVNVSANPYAYAGGIAGQLGGDSIAIDCLSVGNVFAGQSANSSYNSYAGGVIGYVTPDYYGEEYERGSAVINCYHVGTVTGADVIDRDSKKNLSDIDGAFISETLGWESISFGTDGAVTLALAELPATVTVKTVDGETETVQAIPAFGVLGQAEFPKTENKNGAVFYGWSYSDSQLITYRNYAILVKDVVLYARYFDVSAIVGTYVGAEEVNGTWDFRADGTCYWISDMSQGGSYRYDGEHVIGEFDESGAFCGTAGNGKMTVSKSYGLSDYTFELTRKNLPIYGEYIDGEKGNILVFSGQSTVVLHKAAGSSPVSYVFTVSDDTVTVKKKTGAVQLVLVKDGENYVLQSSDVSGVETGLVFEKVGVSDGSDLPFMGTWFGFYPNYSSEGFTYGDIECLEFLPTGTVRFITTHSVTNCRYYYVSSTKTIRFVYSSYVSNFYYDTETGIVYGNFNRGISFAPAVFFFKESPTALFGFNGAGETKPRNYIVKHGDEYYVSRQGEWDKTATVLCDGEIKEGSAVTVTAGGETNRYLAVTPETYGNLSPYYYRGLELKLIGEEEGEYVLSGKTFSLDGIGNASGDYYGNYTVKDGLVELITQDYSLIVFDYAAAKTNGGVATIDVGDGYTGVYFNGEKEENGSIMLIIDGHGGAYYYYYSEYGYRLYWGSGENSYTVNEDRSLSAEFNSAHKANISFSYNGKTAYLRPTEWNAGYPEVTEFKKA